MFANDERGDIAYIPDYRELVREGYGPREHIEAFRPAMRTESKPTQAYYGKGYTIYYGYTAVPTRMIDTKMLYAFGYPVEFFNRATNSETNLDRYAMEVITPYSNYGPGTFVAQSQTTRAGPTTTVQRTRTSTSTANGANPLPAIGEKPSH